jgi:peroxiredoxin
MLPHKYSVGETVKDFSLKNIDEKNVSLASHAGAKGAIVVFTCNHCPFSVRYEDRIINLHKKYADKGFPVIAINPNDPVKVPEDNFEGMQARAKEKGFTFPYLVDDTQETAKAFGADRTPHVFVVTRSGNTFKLAYVGAIDDNANDVKSVKEKYAEDALDNLIAGKAVAKSSTKSVGCSIKWKNS